MIETYVQQLQISSLIFMKFLYMLYIEFNLHMRTYCNDLRGLRSKYISDSPPLKREPLLDSQRFFMFFISLLSFTGGSAADSRRHCHLFLYVGN